MIKIMHRLINITGKYKGRIRASYLTAFLKGLMMKAPLVLCFFCISWFMQGQMDRTRCIYLGVAALVSVILQAVFEHISNVLQSATGYMVFADMRLRLGDHLRKLPMGYFTEGNIGKISSVLATDMVFIEENCMGVLSELVTLYSKCCTPSNTAPENCQIAIHPPIKQVSKIDIKTKSNFTLFLICSMMKYAR